MTENSKNSKASQEFTQVYLYRIDHSSFRWIWKQINTDVPTSCKSGGHLLLGPLLCKIIVSISSDWDFLTFPNIQIRTKTSDLMTQGYMRKSALVMFVVNLGSRWIHDDQGSQHRLVTEAMRIWQDKNILMASLEKRPHLKDIHVCRRVIPQSTPLLGRDLQVESQQLQTELWEGLSRSSHLTRVENYRNKETYHCFRTKWNGQVSSKHTVISSCICMVQWSSNQEELSLAWRLSLSVFSIVWKYANWGSSPSSVYNT